MNQYILSVLFFLMVFISYGQAYKRAKIYGKNQLVLKAANVEVHGANLNFLDKVTSKETTIALSEIGLIKIPKGNYALEGALFGAGTLALTALLIDVDPDPLIDKKRGTGFYIGYTAVGTILGGLAGLLVPKWKPIFSNGSFVGSSKNTRVDFITENDQFTIKISLTL